MKERKEASRQIINSLGQVLSMAFSMLWEILWPPVLGFALSGIVQAVVSHQSMAKALGGDSPKNFTLATLFGIASNSCSYVAVALARSIFQKGVSFVSAMAFELASTNLVIELDHPGRAPGLAIYGGGIPGRHPDGDLSRRHLPVDLNSSPGAARARAGKAEWKDTPRWI